MKNNSNIHNSKTNQHNVTNLRSSQLPRKSDLVIPEDQSENMELSLNETLDMSDYIQEVEPSEKTIESIQNWVIINFIFLPIVWEVLSHFYFWFFVVYFK